MNIHADCVTCMIQQINKALRLLRPSISNDEMVGIQKRIMIKFGNLIEKSAPYHGRLLYQSIAQELGEKDPYKALKNHYNHFVLEKAPQLRMYIRSAPDPLLMALSLAIIGNCIDFGTPHVIDLDQELSQFSMNDLKINHYAEFITNFEKAHKIFIIGDNTGEAVMDMLLIEFLIEFYPDKQVIYAVRGGPAINDVTLTDAQEIGLDKIVKIVEGSDSPGVILELTSPEFQQAFQEADLILSKGQGNFESLDNISSAGEIFFLLKAKCPVVAKMFQVNVGDLIFFHRTSLDQFSI